jgi:exosortase/archaeosortase
MPFVFTEQGVAMLSSVLRSERAIEVNVAIMRGFVRLREILSIVSFPNSVWEWESFVSWSRSSLSTTRIYKQSLTRSIS